MRSAAIGVLLLAAATPAFAQAPSPKAETPGPDRIVSSFSGAGATFPSPIYAYWADAYRKVTGMELQYQSIGSGGGIKMIMRRAVTFGASDAPLRGEDLDTNDLAQFPAVLSGIVVAVNVDGVGQEALALDGPALAGIFLGDIKRWNDPAITRLNPSLQLPAAEIYVIHRSDGSGTTYWFTDYLRKASPEWRSRIGTGMSVAWPVGHGVRGMGTAEVVQQTKGSIGYIELAYARQARLVWTRLINKAGKAMAPDGAAIQAAAANADWSSAPGFGVGLTDQPGNGSWPITQTTFILMPRRPPDPAQAAAALAFFSWAYANGSAMAEKLDYVPLPATVVMMVKSSWRQITADEKPVFSPE